jgi:hypothetical protein
VENPGSPRISLISQTRDRKFESVSLRQIALRKRPQPSAKARKHKGIHQLHILTRPPPSVIIRHHKMGMKMGLRLTGHAKDDRKADGAGRR